VDEVLIRFRLVGTEAQALQALAVQEVRKPREQVRYILRQELARRGLLNTSPATPGQEERMNDAERIQNV
jgi:hypothetical protein